MPAQWHASLPEPDAQTNAQTNLQQWWQRHATLAKLINSAQQASPSIAQAQTRIAQARLAASATAFARTPSLDASASAMRAKSQPGLPLASTAQIGLQTAWEIDLFGGNRAADQAATARLQGSTAQWHDARISVAAEVANLYVDFIACRQLLDVAQKDAASRAATANIVAKSAAQGMSAAVTVAQANAAAAEANSRSLQQQTQCELAVKAMVVLTALPEPELQALLQQELNQMQQKPLHLHALKVTSVPASMLRQRPDVFAAERDVTAASLEIGVADAKRFPRLSLNGAIGLLGQRSNGVNDNTQTWSIGPLTINYPLFDAGQRRANVELAKQQYGEAATVYANKVRVAVKEVEDALLGLHSARLRQHEADIGSGAWASNLAATEARLAQGMASLLEVEEARRLALAAQSSQWTLHQERNRAWVALYRALGGGWDTSTSATQS